MGFSTNQSSSLGDIPDNVVDTVKGLVKHGFLDPEAGYDSLPQLGDDDGFTVVTRGGDDHVTHQGLVDMAHQDGLCLQYTEPVQIPNPEQQKAGEPVVFRAIVVTRRGVFMGYGDATPDDTMVDAIIRMAETRALNRALRDAVNVGKATAEEMPDAQDKVDIK